jgi:hypothetical protein
MEERNLSGSNGEPPGASHRLSIMIALSPYQSMTEQSGPKFQAHQGGEK